MVSPAVSLSGCRFVLFGKSIVPGRQLERVAHRQFSNVKPCHGKILDLKGFEFGAIDYDASDGQSADGQGTDGNCANRERCGGGDQGDLAVVGRNGAGL